MKKYLTLLCVVINTYAMKPRIDNMPRRASTLSGASRFQKRKKQRNNTERFVTIQPRVGSRQSSPQVLGRNKNRLETIIEKKEFKP